MKILVLFLIFSSLYGCAGLFHGTSQTINFNSSPEGAEVIIDGVSRGVTPLAVKLKKNSADSVMIKKEGYKTITMPLEKKYDGLALLNVFWDCSTTDLITGAIYEYEPGSYFANLAANDSSKK